MCPAKVEAGVYQFMRRKAVGKAFAVALSCFMSAAVKDLVSMFITDWPHKKNKK